MSLTFASSPWHRQLRSAAVLLFALVVLAACGSAKVATPSQPAQAEPQQPMATQPAPLPELAHIKVALLLPLSGDQAALGESLLQAAQLALFEAPDSNVELVVRDTGDSSYGAAQAAQ